MTKEAVTQKRVENNIRILKLLANSSCYISSEEKELILKALKKHKGKRKDAALDLGISERTLYRKLKEYDIEE